VSGDASQEETPCIALIGYRGCGKTVVGRLLAERLGGPFLDTDELIVKRAGRSIADIFSEDGERGFRDREAAAIKDAIEQRPTVLSLGGGAIVRPEHIDRIRAAATVIYLSASPEVLFERTSHDAKTADNRPPLTDREGIEEVRRLLPERDPLYHRAAHHVIDVSGITPPEVVAQIVSDLKTKERET